VPRADEIREMLHDLEDRDIAAALATNDGAAQARVLARYTAFSAQVVEYVDWRDDQLDAGLPIIGRAYSAGETGESVDHAWSEYFLARGREAFDRLSRAGDSLEQAWVPALRGYTLNLAVEESQFFAHLAAAPLARAAGELARQYRDLDVEQAHLKGQWQNMGGQDGDVNARIDGVTRELFEVFRAVTAELIAAQRGVISQVEQIDFSVFIDVLSQVPGVPLPDVLAEPLKQLGKQYLAETQRLRRATEAYMTELVGLHRMSGGVAVLFINTREGVRNYLGPRRLETANATFDTAARDARDLAARCPTEEQRVDASRFIDRVVDEVEPVVDAVGLSYRQFVGAHDRVFVGPVGPAAIDTLLQPEVRERAVREFESFDLETRLQQLVATDAPTLFLDIDGLSDQDRQQVREVFLVDWRTLGQGLVAVNNDHLTPRVAEAARSFVAALLGLLKLSRGGEQ
jgi:hypothetical protein